MPRKLLLIGCGDIPRRMLPHLEPAAFSLMGIRRRAVPLPNCTMLYGDAADPEILAQALRWQPDQILITLTPDASDVEAYRRTYLNPVRHIAALTPELSSQSHLIFVSSTGLYSQDCGEWVDETSPAQPARPTAAVLLEAEQAIEAAGNPWTVVRFSGIYGPGRTALLRRALAGQFTATAHAAWTNRIHADDCGALLAHLIGKFEGTGNGILIGTDSCPAVNCDVEGWIAHQVDASLAIRPLNNAPKGKRCINQKLLDAGYRLRYPSYREGYAGLLESEAGR